MAKSKAVFIDSSGFLALLNTEDLFHSQAVKIKDKLIKESFQQFTTNLILHEVTAGLSRKVSRKAAVGFGDAFLTSKTLEVIWSTEEVEKEAWGVYKKSEDASLSLIDCVSFVLMKEYGIKKSFSFDKHFKEYGFNLMGGLT